MIRHQIHHRGAGLAWVLLAVFLGLFLQVRPPVSAQTAASPALETPFPQLRADQPPLLPPAPRKPLDQGMLSLTIETIREQTPRMRSILAQKVEIWREEIKLAEMKQDDKGVENAFHHRTFRFPPLPLYQGYHFITIRVYAEGFISREVKWKGRLLQVGIHQGRTTTIQKLIPFFVW